MSDAAAYAKEDASATESDAPSAASSDPEGWNSDDEPPTDQVDDAKICSRDGGVKKIIRQVGSGLCQPGHNDIVHIRYRVLSSAPPSEATAPVDVEVTLGEDHLPLAIEFAIRLMRVGEVAHVFGPAAFSARASPLTARKLRDRHGRLPKGKPVSRKMRFLPVAPRDLLARAAAAVKAAKAAREQAVQADKAEVENPALLEFRAEVELLHIEPVFVLTEDMSVRKQILQSGPDRRTPRRGDRVHFSTELEGGAGEQLRRKVVLGDKQLSPPGLEHVLLSMREGERCLARLTSPTGQSAPGSFVTTDTAKTAADQAARARRPIARTDETELRMIVTMHSWQRRDIVVVPAPGLGLDYAEAASDDDNAPVLSKLELRPAARRRWSSHAIEDGSMVLVSLLVGAPGAASCPAPDHATLLSWRIGEGAVPRYLEVAVASMRLLEVSAFSTPYSTLAWAPVGPSYEGQTPLRRLILPGIEKLIAALHDPLDVQTAEDGPDAASVLPLPQYEMPESWMSIGEATMWEDLALEKLSEAGGCAEISFQLALLASTEAPDVCTLEDGMKAACFERERLHGDALAKAERFPEAAAAYNKALDAVRHSSIYKALFPTERGHIQGAFIHNEDASTILDELDPENVASHKESLILLHLDLAMCAAREDKPAAVRRHSSIVLGADPDNAKALFRRGSAAALLGDCDEAETDLRRAAELQPDDLIVQKKLEELQAQTKQTREGQTDSTSRSFNPPPRSAPEQILEAARAAGLDEEMLRLAMGRAMQMRGAVPPQQRARPEGGGTPMLTPVATLSIPPVVVSDVLRSQQSEAPSGESAEATERGDASDAAR